VEERNSVFDNHAAFNRWQVMEGMRVNESGAKPSVYITEIKLKKAFARLTNDELQRIFAVSAALNKISAERYQKKINKKLEQLSEEQSQTALNIYLREEDGELCAKYVMACSINKRKKE